MSKDFTKELFLPSGKKVTVTRENGLLKRTFEDGDWPIDKDDEIAFSRWINTPEDEVGYGVPQ